ncbi:hypothetical protein [Mucilaginibacter sp. 21P]
MTVNDTAPYLHCSSVCKRVKAFCSRFCKVD